MAKRVRVDKVRWPGVYHLKTAGDTIYYITYRDGRRKIWEKVGTKREGLTPQVADDIRKDRTLKARHGDDVLTAKQIKRKKALTNKTLDDVAVAYFKQREGQWGKFDQYRYDKHVQPVVGARAVSSLTEIDMKRIEKAMAGLAKATVWGALELVRRIANYGKRTKLTPGLTFIIKMPKRDNQVVEFLTPAEAGRLTETLDTWPARDVAHMLQLAMFSGMRRGEIFKLTDADFDFENKLIRLRAPKGGKTTSIPMNRVAEKTIRDQIVWRDERHPGAPFVFPGKAGGLRVDCSAVDRIKTAASLPKPFRMFHGLRHHYAVTLANSGEFTLDMIGELLTHKSHEMTKRYADYLPHTMQWAGNRAAELLQAAATPQRAEAKGGGK